MHCEQVTMKQKQKIKFSKIGSMKQKDKPNGVTDPGLSKIEFCSQFGVTIA